MFSRLFGGARTPLFDRVTAVTVERVTEICVENRDDGEPMAVFLAVVTMASAGAFLRVKLPELERSLGRSNKDVIAFELLTFSAFGLREYYRRIEGARDEGRVAAAFDQGYGLCRRYIRSDLGSDHGGIFEQRLGEYARFADRYGMRGATDSFLDKLLGIADSPKPQLVYRENLDFHARLQALPIVHEFSSTVLGMFAETLPRNFKDCGLS